ncbi:major head protein [Flavobacterium phage vB_FspS_tant8-1]|uniref:Structural protein n=1 Tax=Flavobacterium phage vB_FspS_tant8-1 TaxID=2686278 RepID=A0A6B9LGX2_9CAUD|nr:major head protein [Flavobacterium phage vB_FspS_tant8-1]QHB40970.1 structural protein [Flavobacterium phage vB_FspS_tant8-1]
MDCNCPAPSALTEIVAENCGVDLKQIQRLGFQRVGDLFDAGGSPATDILTLSVWQAKMTATDNTKIVVTPIIGGDPVIEAGEAITNGGGDNSTMNGVEEVEGVNPSSFSCIFKSLPATTEKAMKKLMCEKNLVVYLFLQGGRIAVVKVSADQKKGFPIQSVFVSDRSNSGYGSKDMVNMSFQLSEGWSDDLEIVKPNFNPLTEL